jgi:hypothetical protein
MLKLTDLIAFTAPNRFHNFHTATIGRFSANGATREDAIDNLEAMIELDSDNYMKRAYRFTASRSTVFVLYWNGEGWSYDICCADRAERTLPSSVGLNADYTYEDALVAMESHVRHYE